MVRTVLLLQRAQVRCLVRELRSHKPGSIAKNENKELRLQYFGHLMQRTDSLEKTLKLGKIEGRRRRGQPRMRCLDGITDLMDTSLSK